VIDISSDSCDDVDEYESETCDEVCRSTALDTGAATQLLSCVSEELTVFLPTGEVFNCIASDFLGAFREPVPQAIHSTT